MRRCVSADSNRRHPGVVSRRAYAVLYVDNQVAIRIKNDLLDELRRARSLVLSAVVEGVKDATFDFSSAGLSAHERYYANLGLVFSGVSVVGTVISAVPVLGSIPGAVVGTIGGVGGMYASYGNLNWKPDFSVQQKAVDGVKEDLLRFLRKQRDLGENRPGLLNPLKDALFTVYRNDSRYRAGLEREDAKQARVRLIWDTLFREIDPTNASNQVHDRAKTATEALYKLVVENVLPRYKDVVQAKIDQLPRGKVWVERQGNIDTGPDPKAVERIRNDPENFKQLLGHALERWRKDYKVVPVPQL